jgi:UDP-2,3-diacylglucosamine pyrophosphatase LpxH
MSTTIFISDLHLGDERSLRGLPGRERGRASSCRPYGQLRANVPLVARFLRAQLASADVERVVILGDLFDGWTIPTDLDPALSSSSCPYYRRSFDAAWNAPILNALRGLAESHRLTCVPGSHDMTVICPDFARFTDKYLPGVDYRLGADLDGHVYRDGHLVAEHGHEYDPFCATDLWTLKPPSMPRRLPLGYYISRVVAREVAISGGLVDQPGVFARFWREVLEDRECAAENAFLALARKAGLQAHSPIDVAGSLPVFVRDVGATYRNVLKEWERQPPTRVRRLEVVLEGLAGCVRRQHLHGPGTRIAISGHTHRPALKSWYPFWSRAWGALTGRCDRMPASHVYANCGTWIDAAPLCTYVETEKDVNRNRHTVRVRVYSRDGTSSTLGERFVALDEAWKGSRP